MQPKNNKTCFNNFVFFKLSFSNIICSACLRDISNCTETIVKTKLVTPEMHTENLQTKGNQNKTNPGLVNSYGIGYTHSNTNTATKHKITH